MNISAKAFIVLFSTIVITSCSQLRGVHTSSLRIGMTKSEVQTTLKKKPNATVAAKNFPELHTIIEVVHYVGTAGNYYLYFVNDKLQKWTPADDHLLYLDDLLPARTSLN
jgi:hypothetical protein